MRYLAKLRATNAPEVYCIFEDFNTVRANGVNTNNAAKLMFYKAVYNVTESVKTSNIPLMREDFEVVSVEPWEEAKLKVVRGNKDYSGLFYSIRTSKNMFVTSSAVCGIKSAYNQVIRNLNDLEVIDKKDNLIVILY